MECVVLETGLATPHRSVAVLVVDDEATSRLVLARQLTMLGYRVLTASDGAEALATLKTLTVDLVLLDVHMPRLNGVDVLSAMQRDLLLRWVPVIMVSADGETAEITRCLALGAEDYSVKPFTPAVLHARIGAALARKQARDAERLAFADLQFQQSKVERLLHQVLPPSIARRLAAGEEHLTDTIPDATVLFADLANFTGLSAELPARRIVRMLDRVFGTFDLLAEQAGAETIKTQGDAYMVTAGVLTPRPDHAAVVANCALAMRAAMPMLRAETGLPLEVRSGIASGPVVAGAVGVRKLSFDVWGDTVNVASRMESHGIAGEIQVTAATAGQLGATYTLTPRGRIAVKGKGELDTFLLVGRS